MKAFALKIATGYHIKHKENSPISKLAGAARGVVELTTHRSASADVVTGHDAVSPLPLCTMLCGLICKTKLVVWQTKKANSWRVYFQRTL